MNGRDASRALVLAITVVTSAVFAASAQAAPTNDNFSAAASFEQSGGTVTSSNVDAAAETGEPDHAGSGFEALHSVWFSWTAAASGQATIATCGSAFNTRLGVYTGDAVGSLTTVTSNEDSTGPGCAGTKFAEATFDAVTGTTYRIAVDTSGDLAGDGSGAPQGEVRAHLVAPQGGGGSNPNTSPSRLIPPRTAQFTVPRLIASCNPNTPTDGTQCGESKNHKEKDLRFRNLKEAEAFLRTIEDQRIATAYYTTGASAEKAATGDQKKALRERGKGGEIMDAKLRVLNFDDSDPVDLEIGRDYALMVPSVRKVRLDVTYFDLAKDKKALADEKAALEKAAEDAKKNRKSKCLPIAAGKSPKQIMGDAFPKNGLTSIEGASWILKSLGCHWETPKPPVDAAPGVSYTHVHDVVGIDAKRDVVELRLAVPLPQDFLFVLREDPHRLTSQATRSQIPLGADGALTASDKQMNALTVQVIERATGRFVQGLDVTFVGQKGTRTTQRTDGNGETTFVAKLTEPGDYLLEAGFGTLRGYRTVQVADRGKASFTSLAGRVLKPSKKGVFGGNDADLARAQALPVVPANLGTGITGPVERIPVISQGAVEFFKGSDKLAGSANGINVPNDSNLLVGAAPGLLAAGSGHAAQAGRSARQGGDPLALLGGLMGSLASAIDNGVSNIRVALSDAHQGAVRAVADLLGAARPPANVISDNGLGVISTGGLNLIGQAGGNVIATDGASIISDNGASFIGTNTGNFIGTNTGNLVPHAAGGFLPLSGGKIISDNGASK